VEFNTKQKLDNDASAGSTPDAENAAGDAAAKGQG
jgi:hypothetical protein